MRNFRSSIVHNCDVFTSPSLLLLDAQNLLGAYVHLLNLKTKLSPTISLGYYMLNKLRWAAQFVEREYFCCCIAAAICSCRIENIVEQCVNIHSRACHYALKSELGKKRTQPTLL